MSIAIAIFVCLPATAAYTLLGARPGRSLRAGGCLAAEKGVGVQGGNALEGPQGGGPAISARALDQLIQADPEKKKQWKGFKRGKKQSERRTEQKSAPSGKGFGGAQAARFDRRPAKGVACGCGSAQSYEACCQPCHEASLATEPLALIRARYTAYAYRLPDFLIDTTSPEHEEWQAGLGGQTQRYQACLAAPRRGSWAALQDRSGRSSALEPRGSPCASARGTAAGRAGGRGSPRTDRTCDTADASVMRCPMPCNARCGAGRPYGMEEGSAHLLRHIRL